MIDLAYVQQKDGEFINETAFSMAYGCRMLGIEVVPYEAAQVDTMELRKETLVHGWIGSVKKALSRLSVPDPTIDCWPPEELHPFYGRKIWTSTLGDLRKSHRGNPPIFVKPLKQHKLFSGHVASGEIRDLIQTASYDDETETFCSEAVKFVSEYRCMLHLGMLVACRHYLGDFTVPLDFDVVRRAVKAFQSAPAGCSMDFGVTDDGRTLLVEVNDGFSLGNYGTPSIAYTQLVISRWEEMVGI